MHRLVDVHGVHRRGVEAGQPHIPHDDQLQGVVGVLGALRQQVAPGLVAPRVSQVRLPVQRVGGRAGHDHLQPPRRILVGVPLRAQRHDRLVERDTDATTHADDHGLAVQGGDPGLEVLHQVGGHQVQALFGPHQGLDGRPLALEPLLFVLGLVLGQVGDLGVDARLLVLGQLDAGEPALVVDRHRRAVLDRAADVVDVDVVAEHRRGVHVVVLDRRPGEADEGGVGQGVAQVLGKAVNVLPGLGVQLRLEPVLAAVRLV
jgi:hypothetical protein